MISELKGLTILLFLLAYGGGMLQVYNLIASTHLVSTALELPTWQHLMMPAMVYPALLLPFFLLDANNAVFRVATVTLISAILGIFIFPALSMVLDMALSNFDASTPWFNLLVIGLDVIAAIVFLYNLNETDLHKMPRWLIFLNFMVLEFSVAAVVFYNSGAWIPAYNYVAAKLGAPAYVAQKPATHATKSHGNANGQLDLAKGKQAAASIGDVAHAALDNTDVGKRANAAAALNTASTPEVKAALAKVLSTPDFSDSSVLAEAVKAGKTDADRAAIATVILALHVAAR